MIIRNTVINIAGKAVTAGVTLALTAVLVRHLGQTNYGVLMLALAIAGNTSVVESLFGVGITRYVAYFQGVGDRIRRDQIISTGLPVSVLQGTIIGLLVVGTIVVFFPVLFGHLDAGVRGDLRVLLGILLLKFVIQVCSTSLMRVLEGYQRFRALRTVDVAFSLGSLAGLFAYVRFFPGVPLWWIGWMYVGLEVGRVALVWAILRWEEIRVGFGWGDRETFWRLFEFGRPLLLMKGMTFLAYRSDALLIGVFLTAEAVAQYQVASQVHTMAAALLSVLTSALLPAISQRASQGSQELAEMFLRASRYIVFSALSVACVVVLLRSPFFAVWVGGGFAEAEWLTFLFMLQFLCSQHQGISGLILVGTARHQPLAWVETLGSTVQFVVALLLIRQVGLYGVVVAGIVKSLLMTFFYTRLALRSLGVKARAFIVGSLAPSWAVGLSVAGLLVAFNSATGLGGSHVVTVFQAAIVSCVMAALSWFVIIEARDRRSILRALSLA